MKKNEVQLPHVTFAIPVLNEEKRIGKCLEAICDQKYPKEKIEIIVMDGGSRDSTSKIAKSFGAKVYPNSERLAEPGLAKAYRLAKGNYVVFMAADNVFFDKQWLSKMINPLLENSNVYASFSKVVNAKSDNYWNKFINEDAEPFSSFVFWNASHPDKFYKKYNEIISNEKYVIYDYKTNDFPLIALAQGTILKSKLYRSEKEKNDDILPLIRLIDSGKHIAFVKNTGLHHYSVKGFDDFKKKFKNRIYNSMKTKSFTVRDEYLSVGRKLRRYLFLPFTLLILPSLIYSIILLIQKKHIYMLLYLPVSLIICYYILYNYLKIKVWRE